MNVPSPSSRELITTNRFIAPQHQIWIKTLIKTAASIQTWWQKNHYVKNQKLNKNRCFTSALGIDTVNFRSQCSVKRKTRRTKIVTSQFPFSSLSLTTFSLVNFRAGLSLFPFWTLFLSPFIHHGSLVSKTNQVASYSITLFFSSLDLTFHFSLSRHWLSQDVETLPPFGLIEQRDL